MLGEFAKAPLVINSLISVIQRVWSKLNAATKNAGARMAGKSDVSL